MRWHIEEPSPTDSRNFSSLAPLCVCVWDNINYAARSWWGTTTPSSLMAELFCHPPPQRSRRFVAFCGCSRMAGLSVKCSTVWQLRALAHFYSHHFMRIWRYFGSLRKLDDFPPILFGAFSRRLHVDNDDDAHNYYPTVRFTQVSSVLS